MIEMDIKYEFGHTYKEQWAKGDLFCPKCGSNGAYEEQAEGDYYVGAGFLCTHCKHGFTIQGPWDNSKNYQAIQRLEYIAKEGK